MSGDAVTEAVDRAFREEWGRVVATLIRRTGDWDLAEECVAEAFAEALRSWPRAGVPQRPGAWLTTVAGNRAVDRLRRRARGERLLAQSAAELLTHAQAVEERVDELVAPEGEIADDRLRLIFTCCHVALPLEARVALTLRMLCGLSTAQIARAFLVSEATMAKRLTRAKHKIAAAGIPYRVPDAHLLPARTGGVLAVLYLMFNEGYAASAGDELIRTALCDEAIRLARLLHLLMPDEPEVMGLLALLLLQHSRRDARLDAGGELITLGRQDRSRWHAQEVSEGLELLEAALALRAPGNYQLQAAIAACHARAASARLTDWPQIAALYELLQEFNGSPVVTLNRAVALSMSGDPQAAASLLARLHAEGTLESYHLLHATDAELLRSSGRLEDARAALTRAIELAPTPAERRLLVRRNADLGGAPQAPGGGCGSP